jgi:hypothetical protein
MPSCHRIVTPSKVALAAILCAFGAFLALCVYVVEVENLRVPMVEVSV